MSSPAATRRIGIALAIPCALAVAGVGASGFDHGHLRPAPHEHVPYELAAVLEVSLLLFAQTVALFWLLARSPLRGAGARVSAAVVASLLMLLAAFALHGDAPAGWLVDLLWSLAMTAVLIVALAVVATRGLARELRG